MGNNYWGLTRRPPPRPSPNGKLMNMARRRRLPPLLSILLAFAATTVPLASAFGAGAPPPPLLGSPTTTRHHDRDPSHSASSSRGVGSRPGGGGGTVVVVAAAPAPTTGGGRAAANRRDVLRSVATGCLASLATAPANADVLRSPGPCANGEGGGCDALSDENEYIKSLQSRSRDNREANQRVREIQKPLNRNYDDDGNLVRFDFGWVGWAAVAVILNDLRTSYLGGCSVCIEETKKTSSTDNAANKRKG